MNSSPVAIITGAAGNLGQAVAVHLGGLGYRLLLIDLNQPDWDGETDAVSIGNVDLTLPEHAQEVVNQAWEYFGQIWTACQPCRCQTCICQGASRSCLVNSGVGDEDVNPIWEQATQ